MVVVVPNDFVAVGEDDASDLVGVVACGSNDLVVAVVDGCSSEFDGLMVVVVVAVATRFVEDGPIY